MNDGNGNGRRTVRNWAALIRSVAVVLAWVALNTAYALPQAHLIGALPALTWSGGPSCGGVSFPYSLSGGTNLTRVANLRNAIECANLNGSVGTDIIDLNGFDVALEANNVYATYTGPTGLPLITSPILIRDGILRHDYSAGGTTFRTFEITASGVLTVQNVVMQGDSGPSPGGAFYNLGTLNVIGSTIHRYNTSNRGGVLYNGSGAQATFVNLICALPQ